MTKSGAVSCGVTALSALVLSNPSAAAPPKVERVAYGGWAHCIRLSNAEVELIATLDVGPRIIRFGFTGDRNEFAEFAEDMGKTGGDEWRLYGGHRLWHAPEEKPRTYFPDNAPVAVREVDGGVELTPPVETTTGIQKRISVLLDGDANRVRVIHGITNTNLWAVSLAPWSLSVMAPGGHAIIPHEGFRPHTEVLLPARPLVLWYYTDMSDPRWTWGRQYIQLQQDPGNPAPQKLGAMIRAGWAAYSNEDHLFIKRFPFVEAGAYLDYGCNAEFFTNERMLEVESLGVRVTLEPGQTVEHEEVWTLHRGLPELRTDAQIEANVLPLVR